MRWNCFHQSASVGIPFRPIYFVSLKDIYQPPVMHDANPVGKLADKVQIMGNEQTCSSGLLLQFYKKIGDRGLYRYVQCCSDFVTYYKFGFGCKRAGDRNALFLATRKLVWEPVGKLYRQTNLFQKLIDALRTLFRRNYVIQL